jgi:hypothetical protein
MKVFINFLPRNEPVCSAFPRVNLATLNRLTLKDNVPRDCRPCNRSDRRHFQVELLLLQNQDNLFQTCLRHFTFQDHLTDIPTTRIHSNNATLADTTHPSHHQLAFRNPTWLLEVPQAPERGILDLRNSNWYYLVCGLDKFKGCAINTDTF